MTTIGEYPKNRITQPISIDQIDQRLQHPDVQSVDVPDQPLDSAEHAAFSQVTAPMAEEFGRQGVIEQLQSWLKSEPTPQEIQRAERGPRFSTLRSLGQSAIGSIGSLRGKVSGLLNRGSQTQAPAEAQVQAHADQNYATILPVTTPIAEPTRAVTVSNTANLSFEPPHSIALAQSVSPEVPKTFEPRKPGDVYSRGSVGNLAFRGATLPAARQTTENSGAEV